MFHEINWQNDILDMTYERNTNLGLLFGTFCGALPFGLFGLKVMTRSLTKSNGLNSRLRTSYGNECIVYGEASWKKGFQRIEECPLMKASVIEEFDSSSGARSILCRHHGITLSWNWKDCGQVIISALEFRWVTCTSGNSDRGPAQRGGHPWP